MGKKLNNVFKIRVLALFAILITAIFFVAPLNIGYADGYVDYTDSSDQYVAYSYNEDETVSETALIGNVDNLPSAVTLVGTTDLPPIDDQGAVGSCVSQGIAYTQFTNCISRYIHANYPDVTWDPSSGDKEYIFSPKFTYTLSGMGAEWVYDILTDHGGLTLDKSSFYKDNTIFMTFKKQ